MKTTLDIADPLLRAAKQIARRERTTMRAIVEQGLRLALEQRQDRGASFKLRDASVGGKGLQPDAAKRSFSELRDWSYEGRGG